MIATNEKCLVYFKRWGPYFSLSYLNERYVIWRIFEAGERLKMENNGNLALKDSWSKNTWLSNTNSSGSYMVIQSDCNLVVYSPDKKPQWQSNTALGLLIYSFSR